MPEFLELLETYRGEDATVEKLFAGDGTGVRTLRGRQGPAYKAKLLEAERFIDQVWAGRLPIRGRGGLMEALSTSDFPLLFGDSIDRQLLARYQEAPASWQAFVKQGTVRDFRTVKRFAIDGNEGVLPAVDQGGEYPAASVAETRYTYSVAKYGRRIAFFWEAMINDDLDALKDMPDRLARAARRSEAKFVTQLYVDASGPHASLYTTGNANKVTSNPVLSAAALQTAMTILANMTDADGEPITIEAVTLVVPPALEVTAENLLNATQLWLQTDGGATAGTHINAVNWMAKRIKMVVDYYIPIVASSANGATSWFLFADPSVGRAALELGKLRGYEAPQIFMKSPNAQRIGGGLIDPMDGDFDTDSLQWKMRHVFGGTREDPKATVGSNGSGS